MANAKLSLKERLAKKRKELSEKGGSGKVNFLKEGTTRIRVLPVGKDEDWGMEVVHFYLGEKIKGVFSPSSIGKDCPIMEAYQEFTKNKKKADLAKAITPKKKYLVPALVYEDEAGKKIDTQRSGKLTLVPNGIYGQMIDLFLDPELGDFTDPKEGYDLKIKRTGKGKTDTEYFLTAARPSSIDSKFSKPVNLEAMMDEIFEDYDSIQEKLDTFLLEFGEGSEGEGEEDEEETPKKPKVKKSLKSKRNG